MYIIKCDDYILHDPRYESLYVTNPKLDLEVNKNGTASFKIYPSHPYYDQLKKLKSVISIYQDNNIIFKGRIIEDELGFYNEKQVSVEGVLAYLLDSIHEPFEYQGGLTEFFTKLINNHNSQVEPFQKFKIGQVTVTDPNDYINRSSEDYLTTKEIIESRLIETNGGYLRVRYEEDGNYIDYLTDFEDTATQTIEFGENLIDLKQKTEATNIKTGIIPLGAKLKDSSGNDTNARLTIESVNNGSKYLIDNDMVEEYGKILEPVIFDDVTIASNLLTKGEQALNEKIKLSNTIELTAIDLNHVDKDIESFHFCDYIRILSSPHNINKRYLLKKISMDLSNPQNTKITLGETFKTLTDINISNNKGNSDLIVTLNKINNDYISNSDVVNIINDSVQTKGIVTKNTIYNKPNGMVIANSNNSEISLSNMPSLSSYTGKRIELLIACDEQNYKFVPFELNSNSFLIDYSYVLDDGSVCKQMILVEINNSTWKFKVVSSSVTTNKEVKLYKIESYS